MAKLAHSAETAIAIIFLVTTLERYIQSMTLFFGAILATVVWPSRYCNPWRARWRNPGK
jgi:hypothetical protein